MCVSSTDLIKRKFIRLTADSISQKCSENWGKDFPWLGNNETVKLHFVGVLKV